MNEHKPKIQSITGEVVNLNLKKSSPLESRRKLIRKLNQYQRDALVPRLLVFEFIRVIPLKNFLWNLKY